MINVNIIIKNIGLSPRIIKESGTLLTAVTIKITAAEVASPIKPSAIKSAAIYAIVVIILILGSSLCISESPG